MKKTWDNIYENSTLSAQTLQDNVARSHKEKSLLKLIKVRDRNDAEPEKIQVRAIETVRIQESVEENESNEEEVMENINKEEDE